MRKGVVTLMFVLGTLTFYYLSTMDQYCTRKAISGKNKVGVDGKPLLPISLDNCASIHTSQFVKSIFSPGKKVQESEDNGKRGNDSVQSKKEDGPVSRETYISEASNSPNGRDRTAKLFQEKAPNAPNASPEQSNMQSTVNEIDHSSPEFVDDNTYYDWDDNFGRNEK